MTGPLLLGHRGHRLAQAWSRGARKRRPDVVVEPENSRPAFQRALDAGCDGVELDLRLSADRHVVLLHDPRLGARAVSRLTLAELRRRQPAVATLAEVLNDLRQRAWLDLEVKARRGVEEPLVAALRRWPPLRGYVVSSFHPGVLRRLAALAPGIPLCLNLAAAVPILRLRRLPLTWVAPAARVARPKYLRRLHAEGWKTLVWTVNRPRRMRDLAAAGVSALVSDDPYLLAATLGKGPAAPPGSGGRWPEASGPVR